VKRLFIRGALIAGALVLIGIYPFTRIGDWLVVQDPLQKADVIFVLGGTLYERPLEAVELYREQWAPRITLMRQIADYGEAELMRRGVSYMREVDQQVAVMGKLGVPASAITILEQANSTAQEADTLYRVAAQERWRKVIIVTSKQHTRRARLVMQRRMAGTGVDVMMRYSRFDAADTEHWWRNRSTLRFTLFETQRLFGYWIGVAD
jgi:uncharacterized SAM-binding protein YcdF (DUF218 family)